MEDIQQQSQAFTNLVDASKFSNFTITEEPERAEYSEMSTYNKDKNHRPYPKNLHKAFMTEYILPMGASISQTDDQSAHVSNLSKID